MTKRTNECVKDVIMKNCSVESLIILRIQRQIDEGVCETHTGR